ncbi:MULTISPECIES: hypothetical protein [Pandoraea]|uniref:hypothetical protein n=1 Tax=Pandoraea TaxID=93217 RepID=UPI001F5D9196|nr:MULTISPECIES: hypothetical protein [Pandoraea]MCI3207397.1 hypothetical protein [Pandoraea sp. LA3]MDN4585426.1 hypothetical protein [Pandoraea capi]
MQIVDQQNADSFVRRQPVFAPIPVPELYPLSAEEEAHIRREAQMLYDATIRGLADVAAGRKLPSEVVKTGCSVDLNPEYFETPHDPDEIDVEEFFAVLMGLRDLEAGRVVPDEIVSAEADEWMRRLQEQL